MEQQRDNDRGIKLEIQGNAMASGSPMGSSQDSDSGSGSPLDRSRRRYYANDRRRVPGFLGPCHGLCHGRQDQVQVSRSITIVCVTYYANDGFWDRHHLRLQVIHGNGIRVHDRVCGERSG